MDFECFAIIHLHERHAAAGGDGGGGGDDEWQNTVMDSVILI